MRYFPTAKNISDRLTIYISFISISLPILFFLINKEWLYPNPVMPDPIINHYSAYFYHLKTEYLGYYKDERVSWLIPLFYIQRIVGMEKTLLLWGVFSWQMISFLYYLLLKNLFGKLKVLLIFPWIILYPHLIGDYSGGGTYHSYAATIYFLISLIFWERGSSRDIKKVHLLNGPVLFYILSGFFLGSTLISSILYLNLLLIYPAIQLFKKKSFYLKNYIYLFLGLVLSYTVWSLINIYLGKGPVSFINRLVTLFHHTDINHYHNKIFTPLLSHFYLKMWHARYLSYIFLFFFANFFLLIKKVKKEHFYQLILNYHACFIIILWIFWHSLGMQALLPSDFVYPVLIPSFIGLCNAIPEKFLKKESLKWSFTISIALFILIIFKFDLSQRLYSYPHSNDILMMWLASILALFLLFFSKFKILWLPSLLYIIIFYSFFSSIDKSLVFNDCKVKEQSHRVITDIVEKMIEIKGESHNFFLFYEPAEILTPQLNNCTVTKKFVPRAFGRIASHTSRALRSYLFEIEGFIEPDFQGSPIPYLRKDIFSYIYEQKAVLGLLTNKQNEYLEQLIKLAERDHFQLIQIARKKIQLVGHEIDVPFFIVEKIPL